jgi:tRNA G10  N-methylase Trm11
MERLTKHRSFDKTLHRGELSPQLAWMMCWLSKPRKEDVVLDPFCGYGAIPGQRINRFPLKKMYAFDRDEGALKCTRSKLKGEERCDIRKLDFRDIPSALPEKSVDTIITDPPWGMFEETDIPLEKFYAAMIRGFRRVLKDQGRVVILTAAKEEFLAALKASGGPGELELRESLQVLVSGKKAGLFSLTFSRP